MTYIFNSIYVPSIDKVRQGQNIRLTGTIIALRTFERTVGEEMRFADVFQQRVFQKRFPA